MSKYLAGHWDRRNVWSERTTMTREQEVIDTCQRIVRLANELGAAVEELGCALARWNAPTGDQQEHVEVDRIN